MTRSPEQQGHLIDIIVNNPDLLQGRARDTTEVLYHLTGNETEDQALASRWWGPLENEVSDTSLPEDLELNGNRGRDLTDFEYHGKTQ